MRHDSEIKVQASGDYISLRVEGFGVGGLHLAELADAFLLQHVVNITQR